MFVFKCLQFNEWGITINRGCNIHLFFAENNLIFSEKLGSLRELTDLLQFELNKARVILIILIAHGLKTQPFDQCVPHDLHG